MRTRPPRRAGFTLLEIMIVVMIIGLLAAIAIPRILKSRDTAQKQTCISNLSQIEGAKQQWGLENGKVDGDTPTASDLFGPDSYIKITPTCPADGTYTLNAIGQNATCSVAGHSL